MLEDGAEALAPRSSSREPASVSRVARELPGLTGAELGIRVPVRAGRGECAPEEQRAWSSLRPALPVGRGSEGSAVGRGGEGEGSAALEDGGEAVAPRSSSREPASVSRVARELPGLTGAERGIGVPVGDGRGEGALEEQGAWSSLRPALPVGRGSEGSAVGRAGEGSADASRAPRSSSREPASVSRPAQEGACRALDRGGSLVSVFRFAEGSGRGGSGGAGARSSLRPLLRVGRGSEGSAVGRGGEGEGPAVLDDDWRGSRGALFSSREPAPLVSPRGSGSCRARPGPSGVPAFPDRDRRGESAPEEQRVSSSLLAPDPCRSRFRGFCCRSWW